MIVELGGGLAGLTLPNRRLLNISQLPRGHHSDAESRTAEVDCVFAISGRQEPTGWMLTRTLRLAWTTSERTVESLQMGKSAVHALGYAGVD